MQSAWTGPRCWWIVECFRVSSSLCFSDCSKSFLEGVSLPPTHTETHTHTETQRNTHTNTHTQKHTHTHRNTHTRMHTPTRVYTQAHIHRNHVHVFAQSLLKTSLWKTSPYKPTVDTREETGGFSYIYSAVQPLFWNVKCKHNEHKNNTRKMGDESIIIALVNIDDWLFQVHISVKLWGIEAAIPRFGRWATGLSGEVRKKNSAGDGGFYKYILFYLHRGFSSSTPNMCIK